MRLKWLIFLSTMLVFLVIITSNAWHLSRLNAATSSKLGEAAFEVSQATVTSLLQQTQEMEQIRLRAQVASILKQLNSESVEGKINLNSFVFDYPEVIRDINLTMTDTATSRYIALESNKQLFEIPIPRTEIEKTIEQAKDNIITTSIISFVLAIVLLSFIAELITRPLGRICTVSDQIGDGDFGIKLGALSRYSAQEMQQLVNSINQMSKHLVTLEQDKQRLKEQQTTSEISEITRGLAHSIRNPLHTILLATSLFEDKPDAQQQIRKQVDRIDQHIRDLMAVTTHESLGSETVNIESLIETSIDTEFNQNLIQFKSFLNHNQKLADILAPEIKSTLSTLISNAKEAVEDIDKPNINVTLYSNEDQRWILVVEDNGKGISQEIADKLFSPHNTDKVFGSGMGLYIARRILRGRYNGDIQYQAAEQTGSRFTITFGNRVDFKRKEKNND